MFQWTQSLSHSVTVSLTQSLTVYTLQRHTHNATHSPYTHDAAKRNVIPVTSLQNIYLVMRLTAEQTTSITRHAIRIYVTPDYIQIVEYIFWPFLICRMSCICLFPDTIFEKKKLSDKIFNFLFSLIFTQLLSTQNTTMCYRKFTPYS
jgi:hypothetical protein